MFFSPFSIAITLLGEERANLSAFRAFGRFVLVWVCRFPLPLDVWEGLRFVIVALPGLFSYLFFNILLYCSFSRFSVSVLALWSPSLKVVHNAFYSCLFVLSVFCILVVCLDLLQKIRVCFARVKLV